MDLLMAEPEMDPTVPDKLKNKQCGRIGSYTSFGKESILNNPAVMAQASFLTIASYKGSLVVVKGFRKRHVEMSRAVKKELYYIKEMSHDNINRFIGACLDQPTVCIDILEKDDLPLDDMFTASLIFDLIKIADFGLHFLRSSDIPTKQASSEKILERVRAVPTSTELTYRPDTSHMTCDECTIRCMMDCWEEDPDLRPEFKYIRIRLKPMQRGLYVCSSGVARCVCVCVCCVRDRLSASLFR
ncbi:hypothetical protein LSH36_549g00036 [Paralvinella palmiformis]|uniref:Tyrosine-protein kinase catalytic domain-containing protein n=1 Tax=Paralvinella palmiformis TaxID=53620 RepID=A0AAD9J873_9ANNE|nr:hypothetical protein LSH36_549g00036 [Paralvinella palmiformis]